MTDSTFEFANQQDLNPDAAWKIFMYAVEHLPETGTTDYETEVLHSAVANLSHRVALLTDKLPGTREPEQPVRPGDIVVLKKKPEMLCQHEIVVEKPNVRVPGLTGKCRLCGCRFIMPYDRIKHRYSGWRYRFDSEAATDNNDGNVFEVLDVRSPERRA